MVLESQEIISQAAGRELLSLACFDTNDVLM